MTTKFYVERAKWARGGKNGPSALLNEKECYCCLGFLAKACGASDREIDEVMEPTDVPKLDWPDGLVKVDYNIDSDGEKHPNYDNSKMCTDIILINDSQQISDTEREKKLTEKFKELDVEVEFID